MSTEDTMQSDPLVTVMYALAVTPLIRDLCFSDLLRFSVIYVSDSQVWYADDATGVGMESQQTPIGWTPGFLSKGIRWQVMKADS